MCVNSCVNRSRSQSSKSELEPEGATAYNTTLLYGTGVA